MGSSLTSPTSSTVPPQEDNTNLTVDTNTNTENNIAQSIASSDDNENGAHTPVSTGSPIQEASEAEIAASVLETNTATPDTNSTTSHQSKPSDRLILLAWLIVLLRTREGNVSFEWRYQSSTQTNTLSMDTIIPSLDSTIASCVSTIEEYISSTVLETSDTTLLVSTSSLGEESEEAKDEVRFLKI